MANADRAPARIVDGYSRSVPVECFPNQSYAGSRLHRMAVHGMAVSVLTRGAEALDAQRDWRIEIVGPIESTSLHSRSEDHHRL
jgi:hypothetical protein